MKERNEMTDMKEMIEMNDDERGKGGNKIGDGEVEINDNSTSVMEVNRSLRSWPTAQ